MFCESALLVALTKFDGRFHLDSIAIMENTMRDFKSCLYELKSILVENRTFIENELFENGVEHDSLKYELVIITSRTLQSFISATARHTLTAAR